MAVTGVYLIEPGYITMNVASCNGNPRVAELDETDTHVRVQVVAQLPPEGDRHSCADSVQVDLAGPLEDRVVIELSTGEEVAVDGR